MYRPRCAGCHGLEVISPGMTPDLRASATVLSESGFMAAVRRGSRRTQGMPAFPGLTDQQLEDLRHHIREQAEAALVRSRR